MLLMRRIVQSCSRGTGLVGVIEKLMDKYRYAMDSSLLGVVEFDAEAEVWDESDVIDGLDDLDDDNE